MQQIAECFDVHYATVNRAVKQSEANVWLQDLTPMVLSVPHAGGIARNRCPVQHSINGLLLGLDKKPIVCVEVRSEISTSKRGGHMRKSMSGLLVSVCVGWAMLAGPALSASVNMPTDTGTIAINTNNFASTVVASSLSSTALNFGPGFAVTFGPFTTAQSIPWVTGPDLTVGLALGAGPAGGVADFIVPAFGLASIVNGAGADFAVWEAGNPSESFLMSVSTDGGATFSAQVLFGTVATNPLASTGAYDVNIGFVNLDAFGIAAGAAVDAIKLSGLFTGIGGSGPDLLAIAALNAGPPTGNVPGIPEPETYVMMLAGLGLLGYAARRRKQRPA